MNNTIEHETADVLIIGGGPGGYVAAIRAAQLGGRVVLVEREKLGGTCLNRGCIPTKTLLHYSEYMEAPQKADMAGIQLECKGFDLAKLIRHKEQVVMQLVQGVNYLIRKNRIELITGNGRLQDANTVVIKNQDQNFIRKARKIIIATGSMAAPLPVEGNELPAVLTSDDALNMARVPQKLVIIGGGAVGIEFAFIYRNLGAQVAVVEMMPQLLPQIDQDIADVLGKAMKKRGIEVYTGLKLARILEEGNSVALQLTGPQGETRLVADQVLAAAGRRPETTGLNLEGLGVKTEGGRISVDEFMETNIKGIYAIGDVTGRIMLAHVASAQGMIAAENALGNQKKMDYKVVPSCIYCVPELAAVGLTEKEARVKGYKVLVGQFPFSASGKAIAIGAPEGLVKIVSEQKYGEILGVHIIGERATDLIAEAALAIRMEATVEELLATIHAHPTMGESIYEAAHGVFEHPIHMP